MNISRLIQYGGRCPANEDMTQPERDLLNTAASEGRIQLDGKWIKPIHKPQKVNVIFPHEKPTFERVPIEVCRQKRRTSSDDDYDRRRTIQYRRPGDFR